MFSKDDSDDDLQMRWGGCVIGYIKDKITYPLYIETLSSVQTGRGLAGSVLKSPTSSWEPIKLNMFSTALVTHKPLPTTFMLDKDNFGYFAWRNPRSTKRGLSVDNSIFYKYTINSIGKSIPKAALHNLPGSIYYYLYNPVYTPVDEIIQKVHSKQAYGGSFSRHFAIALNKCVDFMVLYHKNIPVGEMREDKAVVLFNHVPKQMYKNALKRYELEVL